MSGCQKQQPLSLHAPAGDDITFEELLVDDNPSPDALLESDENTQLVRDALDQLSPEQRAAVVMRYYLDMSESDMAKALDTPKGTVKWRLHAARRQLKRLLNSVLKPIGWEAKNG
ncbi:MAG: sigma-70 family RNA polymerase sigma factor [Anaerolineae bacterium]